MQRLYRLAPEGFLAATDPEGTVRILFSDPHEVAPGSWRYGRPVDLDRAVLMAPVTPGKIVGIGRNYSDHARELDNPIPSEPVIFLKSPSSLIGPRVPIVLPPESERVELEGEIAVVLRHGLRRADRHRAAEAVLGVTAACDVTARDLQRRDPTFARAKSFDSFCPVGPAVLVRPDLDDLTVTSRLNGAQVQHGHCRDMLFDILELLTYVSAMMTLEAGDLVLTGTPAGVSPLTPGDEVEVEVGGVGVLTNPVEGWVG